MLARSKQPSEEVSKQAKLKRSSFHGQQEQTLLSYNPHGGKQLKNKTSLRGNDIQDMIDNSLDGVTFARIALTRCSVIPLLCLRASRRGLLVRATSSTGIDSSTTCSCSTRGKFIQVRHVYQQGPTANTAVCLSWLRMRRHGCST